MTRKVKRRKNKLPNKIRTRLSRNSAQILKERRERIASRLHEQFEEQSSENVTDNHNFCAVNPIGGENLSQKMVHWINKYRIAKRGVNELLVILNSINGIEPLPIDYRTLLKTQTNIELVQITNGKYWYNGIANCLKTIFENLDRNMDISLQFNIDGLPLARSSKETFYPILGTIFGNIFNY